ncbi:hypothetical protein BCR41DRAFT_355154 [Lobosporangium transversale]|uniref:Homeodomain-like protein n=1 Tax=Lobosporangium transversale TaxID=64571 RepID=A0A1Y2GN37_9FUNG|nr:hypothetical protein BCR41DRAFT_355154 [Lobosporangium transversale]ORZ13910.1 hypothetical protein BCR41DRAFT_355154 [Lobosporangium transversale]|eukprot:XP_021880694.1 hypothetical protein BCR41DRAFT_355154 [Lobosporangium transversale]
MMLLTRLHWLQGLSRNTLKNSSQLLIGSHVNLASYSRLLSRSILLKRNDVNNVFLIRHLHQSAVTASDATTTQPTATTVTTDAAAAVAATIPSSSSSSSLHSKDMETPVLAHRSYKRGNYSRFERTRYPWTKTEDELVMKLLKESRKLSECYGYFPDRTTDAILCRLSHHRTRAKAEYMKQNDISIKSESQSQSGSGSGSSNKESDGHKSSEDSRLHMKDLKKNNTLFKYFNSASSQWTPLEDQLLRERVKMFKEEGGRIAWAKVANTMIDNKRLLRTSTSCQRRWNLLSSQRTRKIGAWSTEEKDALKEAIVEQTGPIGSSEDYKRLEKPPLINWRKVAERLGTRNETQCRSRFFNNFHP